MLSIALQEKANTFRETSHGATTVTVTLRDGRRVRDVVLAWGSEIVKVADSLDIPFDTGDIVDIEEQTTRS